MTNFCNIRLFENLKLPFVGATSLKAKKRQKSSQFWFCQDSFLNSTKNFNMLSFSHAGLHKKKLSKPSILYSSLERSSEFSKI
jgi:hypothetical protein